MDSQAVKALWVVLADVLNALEAAGESPLPVCVKGYSAVTGSNGAVEADCTAGRWVPRQLD